MKLSDLSFLRLITILIFVKWRYFYSINLLLFIVSYLLGIIACSGVPNEANKLIFESPRFKQITFQLIPEDIRGENEIKSLLTRGWIFRGSYEYTNPVYLNSLSSQLSNNPLWGCFYGYLKENGFIEFKEYSIPYERENVPGEIFLYCKRDFHKYTNSFMKLIPKGGDNLICLLATRKMEKITYTNKYKQNLFGVELPVLAIKFNYSIRSNLPQLSSPKNLFEGSAKLVKNPDSGKWELTEITYADEGDKEIFKLITVKNIIHYISAKKMAILKELDAQRKVNLSKANKFAFTIEANTSPSPWRFIGVLTSEDAFEIEPMRGKIDRIGLTIVTNMLGDYIDKIQERYKLGAVFQGSVGIWFNNEELTYNTNKLFMDVQSYKKYSGRDRVSIYTIFAKIAGDRNAIAKVKIHCVDNLRINWGDTFFCGDYPSPQDSFRNPDKSCVKCSKRFNKGKLLRLTSFIEEAQN